jgi:hypothetical protein
MILIKILLFDLCVFVPLCENIMISFFYTALEKISSDSADGK